MPDCYQLFYVSFGELPWPSCTSYLLDRYTVFRKNFQCLLVGLFQGRRGHGDARHAVPDAPVRLAAGDVVAVVHVRKFPIHAYIRVLVGGDVQ